MVASVPAARDGKAPPGLMGGSAFVPRFRNLKKGEKRNFIKGYCLNISSGGSASPHFFATYGEDLERKLESYAGSCVTGSIYGERVARFENYVRINKDVVDAWGIPVLHIDYHNTDNERNMAKDAADTLEELFRACGWDILSKTDRCFPAGPQHPRAGHLPHGRRPQDQRAEQLEPEPRHQESLRGGCRELRDLRLAEPHHDHPGALHARFRAPRRTDPPGAGVTPAAAFVTCGWQNSTMTILTLAMRASEHLGAYAV